jgi:hypothetical protein
VAIDMLQKTHAQQEVMKSRSKPAGSLPALTAALALDSNFLSWLLVRSRPQDFGGSLLVASGTADPAVASVLLSAPSRVTSVAFNDAGAGGGDEKFDCILSGLPRQREEKEALLARLKPDGSLFVVTERPSETQDAPGWLVTSEELALTSDEHLLLALARWMNERGRGGWKKSVLGVCVAPLVAFLASRLLLPRGSAAPSGWTVERWQPQH